MDFSLGQKRKKEKKETSFFAVNIDVTKPGGNKYTEVDFDDFKKEHSLASEADCLGDEFSSYKTGMDVVRRLEAKYNKKGKKKKYRFDQDDFIDRSAGYDFEDGFIDDSEAFEEALPSTMETIKGGFYVNRGTLELRQLEDEIEEEIESEEDEEERETNKTNKKKDNEREGNNEENPAKKQNVVEKEKEVSRMTGAPPTKRAMTENEKNGLDAKRKRLVGNPPTLKKTSEKTTQREKTPTQNGSNTPTTISKPSTTPVVQSIKSTPIVASPKVVAISSTSSSSSSSSISSSVPKPSTSQPQTVAISSSSNSDIIILDEESPIEKEKEKNEKVVVSNAVKPNSIVQIAAQELKRNNAVLNNHAIIRNAQINASPKKNEVLVQYLIDFFKKCEEQKVYGKKRMTDDIVDSLIKIEEHIGENHISKSEKNSLWEYVSKQLNVCLATIKNRIMARKNDLAKVATTTEEDVQVVQPPTTQKIEQQGTRLIARMDVPHLSETDCEKINGIIQATRSTCVVPDNIVRQISKEINEKRADLPTSINIGVSIIKRFVDVNGKLKVSTNAEKLPEQMKPTRKSRVYLDVWAKESQLYFTLNIAGNKKTQLNIDKNLAASNVLMIEKTKSFLNQMKEVHIAKISQQKSLITFVFQYNDGFISAVHSYMEEIYEMAVILKKGEPIITALNSIYHVLKNDVAQSSFFIEICRRLPKIAFILLDKAVVKILADGKMFIEKHQVVQNPKFALKWPNGFDLEHYMRKMDKDGKIIPNMSPAKAPSTLALTPTSKGPSTSSPSSVAATTAAVAGPSSSSSSSSLITPVKKATNDVVAQIPSSSASSQTPKALLEKIAEEMVDVFLNRTGVQMNLELTKIQQKYGNARYQEASPYFQAKLKPRVEAQVEKQRKAEQEKLEAERKRLEIMEAEKRRLAEEKRKKLEQERIEREKLRIRLKEEERLRKEKEIREAREKKEKEMREARERKEREIREARERKEREIREARERKEREIREAKERKEREAREARERKEREEEERRREQERIKREIELFQKQKEAEEALRQEIERQKRLEKELQEAEKQRAEERSKQMQAMRLKAEEQRKNEQEMEMKPFSSGIGSYSNSATIDKVPIQVKSEPISQEIEEADAIMQRLINSHIEKNASPSGTMTTTATTAPSSTKNLNNIQQQQQQSVMSMNSFSQPNFGATSPNNPICNSIPNTSMMNQNAQFQHQTPVSIQNQSIISQRSINFAHQQQQQTRNSMNNQNIMNFMQQSGYQHLPQNAMSGIGMNMSVPMTQPIGMGFQANSISQQQQQQLQQQQQQQQINNAEQFMMRQQLLDSRRQDDWNRLHHQQQQLQQQQQQQQQQQKNMFHNQNYGFR